MEMTFDFITKTSQVPHFSVLAKIRMEDVEDFTERSFALIEDGTGLYVFMNAMFTKDGWLVSKRIEGADCRIIWTKAGPRVSALLNRGLR